MKDTEVVSLTPRQEYIVSSQRMRKGNRILISQTRPSNKKTPTLRKVDGRRKGQGGDHILVCPPAQETIERYTTHSMEDLKWG